MFCFGFFLTIGKLMKIPENYFIKSTDCVNLGDRKTQFRHIKYYLLEIKVSLEVLIIFRLPV